MEAPKKKTGRPKLVPYDTKKINGVTMYNVGIDEEKWVTRQRAHQIWTGYTSNRRLSPEALEAMKQRAKEERARFGQE